MRFGNIYHIVSTLLLGGTIGNLAKVGSCSQEKATRPWYSPRERLTGECWCLAFVPASALGDGTGSVPAAPRHTNDWDFLWCPPLAASLDRPLTFYHPVPRRLGLPVRSLSNGTATALSGNQELWCHINTFFSSSRGVGGIVSSCVIVY